MSAGVCAINRPVQTIFITLVCSGLRSRGLQDLGWLSSAAGVYVELWVGFKTLCFGWQFVILSWQQVVQVTHSLEKDVEASLSFDSPKDAAVLEPGVRKDAMQPAEDVDQALDADILAMNVVNHDEAAWKDLLVRNDVGSPVEGVAAVIYGTAALRCFVYGTEKLPFGGAHLGAGVCAAGGAVEEEAADEGVALRDEEAAELVEPEGAVDAIRRLGELQS